MGGRLLLLLLAVLAAGACEVAVDPIEVPPGCPDLPLRGPEAVDDVPLDRLIDDFEDGDSMIATVMGRTGLWMPMSNLSSTMLFAVPSTACAARGRWAGHFAAAGFTAYGADVQGYLMSQSGPGASSFDGSAYSGISFWAATGSRRDAPPLEMGLTTVDAYYRTTIQLTHSWKRFVIPYSSLAPEGDKPPLNSEKLVSILIWPEKQFDLWIDDVRFEL